MLAVLCGKKNLKRRRQLTPYTFFYGVVAEAASVSDVINFRLESVMTPRRLFLRSSSPSRVYLDYYFHVGSFCSKVWV